MESALLEHPAVIESAVVSSPDEMRGEVSTAFQLKTFFFIQGVHSLLQPFVHFLMKRVIDSSTFMIIVMFTKGKLLY